MFNIYNDLGVISNALWVNITLLDLPPPPLLYPNEQRTTGYLTVSDLGIQHDVQMEPLHFEWR
jgi:hypothetical protein